jgi:ABC-type spermidine/putrescine transport system permease subunit II
VQDAHNGGCAERRGRRTRRDRRSAHFDHDRERTARHPTGLALAHTAVSLPLCIWLLTSFFESIPIELEEAAQVDGANRMRILL